jgi:ATP-dependent DNA helicase RecG
MVLKFQNLSGGFEVTLVGPGKSFEKEIEKEKLHKLEINQRQKKAIKHLKSHGSITRSEYMAINNVSHKTAHLELKEMVEKNILIREGKGRAIKYLLKR